MLLLALPAVISSARGERESFPAHLPWHLPVPPASLPALTRQNPIVRSADSGPQTNQALSSAPSAVCLRLRLSPHVLPSCLLPSHRLAFCPVCRTISQGPKEARGRWLPTGRALTHRVRPLVSQCRITGASAGACGAVAAAGPRAGPRGGDTGACPGLRCPGQAVALPGFPRGLDFAWVEHTQMLCPPGRAFGAQVSSAQTRRRNVTGRPGECDQV